MMIAVTAWQITCNGCGDEFTAPRAQDYWSADEIDGDLDWRLEANDWTRSEDGTRHRCRDCSSS